jgi:hypothetical protein
VPGMPDAATVSCCVAAVREVLPDYGAGYLTACLYHANWQPEQVRARLGAGAGQCDTRRWLGRCGQQHTGTQHPQGYCGPT